MKYQPPASLAPGPVFQGAFVGLRVGGAGIPDVGGKHD